MTLYILEAHTEFGYSGCFYRFYTFCSSNYYILVAGNNFVYSGCW